MLETKGDLLHKYSVELYGAYLAQETNAWYSYPDAYRTIGRSLSRLYTDRADIILEKAVTAGANYTEIEAARKNARDASDIDAADWIVWRATQGDR